MELGPGWVKDKFGLAWQIVPRLLGEYLSDSDPEKSQRVMKAMMQMYKLDIDKLKQAYEGK
jgi:predicted 3-demethylubiquinone-9 3-methyltransferase (glyoxalase superfamily)